jgi:hypothetical protein
VKVKDYVAEWTVHAHIHLEWVTSGDAEIRISFADDGFWSLVGKGCLSVPSGRPTMNLALSDEIEEATLEAKILHEFGHALGCIHEDPLPDSNVHWENEAVYNYYEKGWWKEESSTSTLPAETGVTSASRVSDPESIMLYPIPLLPKQGTNATSWSSPFSDMDKLFIAKVYPRRCGLAIGCLGTSNNWKEVLPGAKNSMNHWFGRRSCSIPPRVFTCLNMVDINGRPDNKLRIHSFANSVTAEKFTLHIDTWNQTVLYNARVSWLKLSDATDIQCGIFNTKTVRPWVRPGNVQATVKFNRAFPRPPTVFVGLSGFYVGKNWQIHLYTSNVGCNGFDIHFDACDQTTRLYEAQAVWIAFPAGKAGISVGDFNGRKTSGWEGSALFPEPFDRIPKIFTAFTKIDASSAATLRARLDTRAFKTHMEWGIATWADTELREINASYLAIDTQTESASTCEWRGSGLYRRKELTNTVDPSAGPIRVPKDVNCLHEDRCLQCRHPSRPRWPPEPPSLQCC